ncbi:hypothetical protein BD324DRAFT_682279 [Kockovaella imperatae]|uniref:Uncharacterized protein n=1 Tax=Kockovaella imperatae TaxID=4999 RepID=A0A1Y1UDT3_9TREE|nr:hypothetical protein BD324DRAFT_682279 [Kockovaella imperatae]ORX36149.1 hypothetical protein BD324DRAFT_682279 [Kockovaella imperatae]
MVALIQVLLLAAPAFAAPYEVSRTSPAECHTNAECLAAGLPLLKPSPRRSALQRRSSGNIVTYPVVAVVSGTPGPNPTLVRRSSIMERAAMSKRTYGAPPSNSLGYLAALTSGEDTYGAMTQATSSSVKDPTQALYITYDHTVSGPQNLETQYNSATQYLCLNDGVGEDDDDVDNTMGPANEYGATALTLCQNGGQPGTSAQTQTNLRNNDAAEAFIFSVDSDTGLISFLWTNPNGAVPQTTYLLPVNDPEASSNGNTDMFWVYSVDQFDSAYESDYQELQLYAVFPQEN